MKITLQDGLPVIDVILQNSGRSISLKNVVIDTGSATSIFASHLVRNIGLKQQATDVPIIIRGVGGKEYVYTKQVDAIVIGEVVLPNAIIDIGEMAYGFDVDGLLGIDLLQMARMIIDLDKLELIAAK